MGYTGGVSWHLTRFEPTALAAIARFQEHLWAGGVAANTAYFRWKYEDSPLLDHRYVVLAFDGKELVGMLGAAGARFSSPSGEQLTLPCVSDTLVAASHRGSGLFLEMLRAVQDQAASEGLPWVLDFGDQPASMAMMMRGWRPTGPWPMACCRTPPPLRPQGPRSGQPIRRTTTPPFPQMAALTRRLAPQGQTHLTNDAASLAWRLRNPLAHFQVLLAGAPGALEGYLILHASTGFPDWPHRVVECRAASELLWLDLLEAATACAPKVELWTRGLSPARQNGLKALGFSWKPLTGRLMRDRNRPNLLVYPTAATRSGFEDPASWDLNGICGRSWR